MLTAAEAWLLLRQLLLTERLAALGMRAAAAAVPMLRWPVEG